MTDISQTPCAGLDISMTSTGLAIIKDREVQMVTCLTTKADEGTVEARAEWTAKRIIKAFDSFGVQYVATEGPAFARAWQQFHMGRFHGVVRYLLEREGWMLVEVPPSSLKKFATGKGNAKKQDMIEACRKWLPNATHDEADAAWLARYIQEVVRLARTDEHGDIVLSPLDPGSGGGWA